MKLRTLTPKPDNPDTRKAVLMAAVQAHNSDYGHTETNMPDGVPHDLAFEVDEMVRPPLLHVWWDKTIQLEPHLVSVQKILKKTRPDIELILGGRSKVFNKLIKRDPSE